jgi:hypothetical protein
VCALSWRWHVTTGIRDGLTLGPALYREIVYERLVAAPEAELRALSEFIGLPYADEMLTYHEGKRRELPGLSSKAKWLPPTPGLRDWRAQMAEPDVELFEALAGDVLSLFGYERAFERFSAPTQERAARCRPRFEQEVRARNRQMATKLDLRIEPTAVTRG